MSFMWVDLIPSAEGMNRAKVSPPLSIREFTCLDCLQIWTIISKCLFLPLYPTLLTPLIYKIHIQRVRHSSLYVSPSVSVSLENPDYYQFSRSVVSDSLWPHESQHTRPPCPSPTPRAYSNSCPSSCWCHPAISSSVVPFSSCPQSLPASGSFPMSQLFVWGGQSIGVSASASVLPMNTQDWSPLGWTGSISFPSKGFTRVFSNTTVQKHQFFCSAFFTVQLSHPYITTGKTIAWLDRPLLAR